MVGAAADTEAVAEGTEAAEVTGPRAENHCQSHSFADCGFEGVYHWAATADGVRCPGMEAEVVATTGEVEEATAAVEEAVTAAAAVEAVATAIRPASFGATIQPSSWQLLRLERRGAVLHDPPSAHGAATPTPSPHPPTISSCTLSFPLPRSPRNRRIQPLRARGLVGRRDSRLAGPEALCVWRCGVVGALVS